MASGGGSRTARSDLTRRKGDFQAESWTGTVTTPPAAAYNESSLAASFRRILSQPNVLDEPAQPDRRISKKGACRTSPVSRREVFDLVNNGG